MHGWLNAHSEEKIILVRSLLLTVIPNNIYSFWKIMYQCIIWCNLNHDQRFYLVSMATKLGRIHFSKVNIFLLMGCSRTHACMVAHKVLFGRKPHYFWSFWHQDHKKTVHGWQNKEKMIKKKKKKKNIKTKWRLIESEISNLNQFQRNMAPTVPNDIPLK